MDCYVSLNVNNALRRHYCNFVFRRPCAFCYCHFI